MEKTLKSFDHDEFRKSISAIIQRCDANADFRMGPLTATPVPAIPRSATRGLENSLPKKLCPTVKELKAAERAADQKKREEKLVNKVAQLEAKRTKAKLKYKADQEKRREKHKRDSNGKKTEWKISQEFLFV